MNGGQGSAGFDLLGVIYFQVHCRACRQMFTARAWMNQGTIEVRERKPKPSTRVWVTSA